MHFVNAWELQALRRRCVCAVHKVSISASCFPTAEAHAAAWAAQVAQCVSPLQQFTGRIQSSAKQTLVSCICGQPENLITCEFEKNPTAAFFIKQIDSQFFRCLAFFRRSYTCFYLSCLFGDNSNKLQEIIE